MWQFRKWNNGIGWAIFFVAAFFYLITIEPTTSFWDCSEFIAASYKLEIGHPPGAPLFLLLGRIASLLAPDPTKVAMAINAMSALASAFTILFLFWTITHLSKKLLIKENQYSFIKIFEIIGAGAVGALAYAFSDTFWFSAVEAEVYSTSSLFTAVVFWCMLKWEENAETSNANRWIILIAYLMGLSIGVHLLNLLAIPAMVMIYYFKKYQPSWKGIIKAIFLSFLLLALIQFGIISGTIKLAVWLELFFVNTLSLPYNSGVITYFLLLISVLILGIRFTQKRGKVIVNTVLIGISMLLVGFSSYTTILIRASANPPLNENNPDNVFSLLSYLNRDQYGDRPLLYGQYYNAPIVKTNDGKPTYVRDKGKYIVSYRKPEYIYDKQFTTLFPRMYSSQSSHVKIYTDWTTGKGKPIAVTKNGVETMVAKPTFLQNVEFCLKYQLGYMYFRYFMWNFSGRLNNIDGNGGIVYGSWITGIPLFDNWITGPSSKLPNHLAANKGHNKYFLLPIFLGLAGLFYQLRRSKRDFAVVFLLFFMTGIAIVLYLNQTPLQPRERDYAYAGSFYAFSIWIGLGVIGLSSLFKKWRKGKTFAIASVVLCFLAVPANMAFQNFDDHNRSGRYTARDVAFNYLNSCAPNAILFTSGDNDTFPLWYLQEVEGVRTDVRIINLMLLTCDWYIDQLKQRINQSDPVQFSLTSDKYREGKRDFVYIIENTDTPMKLADAIARLASDDPKTKYELGKDDYLDFLPTRYLTIPVDTALVVANNTVPKYAKDSIVNELKIHLSKSYFSKSELIVMDILATNQWKRPIYYTSANQEGTLGLDNYLQLEGFAYRLIPLKNNNTGAFNTGRIESSILYENLMNKFRWGRMNEPGVLIDDQNIQTFRIVRVRNNFARLSEQLYREGKKDSAKRVLHRCVELMPTHVFPPDYQLYKIEETAFIIGETDLGRKLLEEHSLQAFAELEYYFAMNTWLQSLSGYERSTAELTIMRLTEIAEKAKQQDLSEKYRKRFKVIVGFEIKSE